MNIEDFFYISEDEFNELDDKAKWKYILSLRQVMTDLNVMAEKNCADCEQYHTSSEDLNIGMLFEDWRDCSDNCDNCGKEERVYMCDLQFQLISHLADQLNSLRNKVNGIVKYMLKKTDAGENLLSNITKDMKASKSVKHDMYL